MILRSDYRQRLRIVVSVLCILGILATGVLHPITQVSAQEGGGYARSGFPKDLSAGYPQECAITRPEGRGFSPNPFGPGRQ